MTWCRKQVLWPVISLGSSSDSNSDWRKCWWTATTEEGTLLLLVLMCLRSASRLIFISRSSSTRCLSVSRSYTQKHIIPLIYYKKYKLPPQISFMKWCSCDREIIIYLYWHTCHLMWTCVTDITHLRLCVKVPPTVCTSMILWRSRWLSLSSSRSEEQRARASTSCSSRRVLVSCRAATSCCCSCREHQTVETWSYTTTFSCH